MLALLMDVCDAFQGNFTVGESEVRIGIEIEMGIGILGERSQDGAINSG